MHDIVSILAPPPSPVHGRRRGIGERPPLLSGGGRLEICSTGDAKVKVTLPSFLFVAPVSSHGSSAEPNLTVFPFSASAAGSISPLALKIAPQGSGKAA